MTEAVGKNTALAQAESGLPDLIGITSTLRKHWPLVAACIVLGGGAGLLATKLMKPVYQVSATLEFDPNAVRALSEGNTDGFSSYVTFLDNQSNYETQYKVVLSDHVLTRVVTDLNLLANDPSGRSRPGGPTTLAEAAAAIRGKVTVEPVKGTRLFALRVEDTDPKEARRLCDAIVATYLTQNVEKSISASSNAVVWLNGQVDHYKAELEANENSLHEFKVRNQLPSASVNDAMSTVKLEIAQYGEALTHTRTTKQALTARVTELSKVEASPEQLPASELLSNAFLSNLRTQYQDAVKERRGQLAEGRGENHPLVRILDEKISSSRDDLVAEVRTMRSALERDLAILARQEAGELALYEDARRRAVELNVKEIEYHRLDRDREQNEKLFSMLIDRMKQADLARMMNVNNVRLLDAPQEPRSPIRPRGSVNLGIGALIGLLLGLALAWLRQALDRSLKTPADVEQALGAPFLGLVPEIGSDVSPKRHERQERRNRRASAADDGQGNQKPELIVHHHPLSGVAEAARTIRTNLMFMNPDQPFRTLLVASAAPSEGKTTVACSIAIALAQSGRKVCIVDCDLRRPRLHRVFGRVGDAGITNVLIDEAKLGDVTRSTVVDGLSCIPAGAIPPNPADLFHSDRFKHLLAELCERFDNVILDTPPLLAVTDAAIISTSVDACVFVTRAFKTSRQLSRQGLRALATVDARVAGVVLNAVDLKRTEFDYYYHYSYTKTEAERTAEPGPPGGGSGGAAASATG